MPIPIEYEFRGFINNKKLNALSQYYVLFLLFLFYFFPFHLITLLFKVICFFPHLLEQREKLCDRIQRFFEQQVLPVFPFTSMVVDFAYEPSTDRIYVLELNPYKNFDGSFFFLLNF